MTASTFGAVALICAKASLVLVPIIAFGPSVQKLTEWKANGILLLYENSLTLLDHLKGFWDLWTRVYLETCLFSRTFLQQKSEFLVSGLVMLVMDFRKLLTAFFFSSFFKVMWKRALCK